MITEQAQVLLDRLQVATDELNAAINADDYSNMPKLMAKLLACDSGILLYCMGHPTPSDVNEVMNAHSAIIDQQLV